VLARGHRIHAIDEGPEDGIPVVLQHGNPTWCFLYRKVIAALLRLPGGERLRIVAPDLLGCGLSDKPRSVAAHTVREHVATLDAALAGLGVERAGYVGQDWGGPIATGAARLGSLRGQEPLGFLFMNTAVLRPARPPRATPFHHFANAPLLSELAFFGALFPVPVLARAQGDPRSIGLRELRAYAYPFARLRDRAAPLGLARMVPNRDGHPSLEPLDEIGSWIEGYRGPVSLLWGTRDPILGRSLKRHREAFPAATVETTDAGHFLQEEVPDQIARAILALAERAAAQRSPA
jgi:haloalkane dehalogenase